MKRTIIGIDIGGIYTKVVEVDYAGRLSVINMLLIPTPFLSNAKETGIDKRALCDSIFKKISLAHIKESRVAINIPIFSPVVTTIILPRMNKKELSAAAITEARRKMIPQPGPNSIFETAFLGELVEANIPRYEVLVVREEKEFVIMALDFFKEFDLYPSVVTPVCASLGSIFAKKPEYRDKEIALIDIGHSSMSISIIRGFNIIFNRNVSFGCKDIIQGLASGLGLPYQQAENILLKRGLPDVKFDPKDRVAIAEEIMRQKYETGIDGKAAGDVNLLELRMLMEPFLERVVQEIRRTFIYFKERYEARKIEKIFFLGGGALISNFVNVAGTRISPSPEIMDVSKLMGVSFKDSLHKDKFVLFSGAAALALSTTLKIQDTINFLPFEFKRKEEIAIKRSIFSAVCILVICGFLLGWINLWVMGINAKRSLKRVNFEIGRLKGYHEEEKSLAATMKSIEDRENAVKSLIKNRKDFLPVLSSLAIREIDQMFFSYLYIGKPKQKEENQPLGRRASSQKSVSRLKESNGYVLELKVNILGNYEKAYSVAETLVSDLRKTTYFNNIKLISPSLNTIIPVINENKVDLTAVKWRKFTVKAKLNI